MTTKICFKCNIEKPLSDYYKHKMMSDGHLNKCKVCTKKDTREREIQLTSTPEGLEKERERHRDKYKRLGYKDKQKEWDKNKPWKNTQVYKNLSRKFKTPRGIELHHWNYNNEFLEDVFILSRQEHKKAHIFLELDLEKRIFKDLEGNYLNTKEEHFNYLIKKGVYFWKFIN
jgi:hypothetical protein